MERPYNYVPSVEGEINYLSGSEQQKQVTCHYFSVQKVSRLPPVFKFFAKQKT